MARKIFCPYLVKFCLIDRNIDNGNLLKAKSLGWKSTPGKYPTKQKESEALLEFMRNVPASK